MRNLSVVVLLTVFACAQVECYRLPHLQTCVRKNKLLRIYSSMDNLRVKIKQKVVHHCSQSLSLLFKKHPLIILQILGTQSTESSPTAEGAGELALFLDEYIE